MTPAIRLWCGLFAGLMIAPAFGVFASNSHWTVRTWRSDDGLPNNQITGLAQTSDGYLWVATYSCPTRFDGAEFEEFPPSDFTGRLGDRTTAMLVTRDGGLWFAMLQGALIRMNSREVRVLTNGLPDKVVRSLLEDAEGNLWVLYHGGALCRLKGDSVRTFGWPDGWPSIGLSPVASLTQDSDGRIWFAKRGRVGVFRDDNFITLLELPDVAARLAPRRAGGVWIGHGARLFSYEESGGLREHGMVDAESSKTEPTALLEDRTGALWIGTSDSGLFRYDGSRFERVLISDRNVTCLMQDEEGNIWAGTGAAGLNRVRPRIARLETEETGLPAGGVQSLCEDAEGRLWAATRTGLLASWKDGEWRVHDEHWPGGRVSCVAADPRGGVWIGTRDRALHRWRDGILSTWQPADGLVGREVRCLVVSRSGDVWIGGSSPDAIQRLRGEKLENFPVPSGIRLIRAMAEDINGNIWAGTSKGVLLRVTPDGEISDETMHTTETLNSIRCLHASADGGLWLGYADDGLGWLKEGKLARLTSRDGLIDDTLSHIVEDEEGWFWFGSDRGIFKVRRGDLERAALGAGGKFQAIRYGRSEGLLSLEATTDVTPGAMRKRDGSLWFPMRTGLAVVDRSRNFTNSKPPSVLLREFATESEVLARYGGVLPARAGVDLAFGNSAVRLEPGHRQVRFSFSAPSFAAPENVLFRYRLEPFDRDWIEAGAQRSASYPRLPPGRYRFRVSACNSAGVWNEEGTVFAFTVIPFVWQTWWFRLITLAATLGTTIGLVRYVSFRRLRSRLRKLEQETALDRERARIARDIHDDLGGRLTEVELLIAMAQRTPSEEREGTIRRMASAVREAGESLDEIVWAVNPRQDSLPHLINYLGQYAIQFLSAAGIRCRVDFPEQPPAEPLPPEVRHNLFLAVKEALNNVARHSGATEVWFRIALNAGRLSIEVEDNGRGLSAGAAAPGADGLGNMRQRTEELGGEFRIETASGGGTRILLLIPWPPKGSTT